MSATHLTKRFVTSLLPFSPTRANDAWARSILLEGEIRLWEKMSAQDRRHSLGVARRVEAQLGIEASRPVMAAALLHDVGKIDANMGTLLRVVATISAAVAGRETAELWVRGSGITRRIGLYLKHPELGGDLLAMAGSDPFTATWAREHHLPEDQCSLDSRLAEVLRNSDND